VKRVVVRRGRAKPLWLGHPWVFAESVGEVREGEGEAAPDVVRVVDEAGREIGTGLLSERSALRVRMLALGEPVDAEDLLRRRVASAAALRGRLFPDPAATDAYRLVHSEGDGLPGLVVDRYGPVLSAQFATAPMHRRRDALAAALLAATGARSLIARPAGFEEEEGIDPASVAFAAGAPCPDAVEVVEEGMALRVSPREGQKTGHYADQRENRVRAAEVAAGGEVLDLFCGTGGFSIQALRRGAASALAVDGSARAVEAAAANAALNGVGERLRATRGDVRAALADLRREGREFDLVVLDPPNLFPRHGPPEAAVKAHRETNVLAMVRVRPGGFLATFTCSARLDPTEFLGIVRAAARECRRSVAILRELSAGPDHPVSPGAREGRYLTGLLARVGS
jgi:23S rRNA (cytosine1962-C5)-methyltransferase